jgi:hypothetical protein
MLRVTRAVFVAGSVVLAVAACGGSIPMPQAPVDDAGADSDPTLIEAGDPLLPPTCGVEIVTVPGNVSCAQPCGGDTPTLGASCSGHPNGAYCEVGGHPDPSCNEWYRCDDTLGWKRVNPASTTGRCAPIVNASSDCERADCVANGVACLSASKDKVCVVTDAGRACAFAGLDRLRLGCACSGKQGTVACLTACEAGLVVPTYCPPPPG